MANTESILTSVKKVLGIAEDYTAFDVDILMHINTAFSVLNQIGLGPVDGFVIEDKDATWDAFLGSDLRMNSVKTFVYLKVKNLFDPPTTSYLATAAKNQEDELLWRLNIVREGDTWTPAVVP